MKQLPVNIVLMSITSWPVAAVTGKRILYPCKIFLILLLAALPCAAFTQAVQISGHVANEPGEPLQHATISIFPDSVHTSSNNAGRFVITVGRGAKTIVVSHVGFRTYQKTQLVNSNIDIRVVLESDLHELHEVVVEGRRSGTEDLFDANRTSSHFLSQDDVKGIPVLGGEADVIKTLQLLPGTVRGVEGSSDLFVRGGAADQNLVLLDDIPIYNTSHLFGFLSVFNPDVLDHVEAINGGFPAAYGGRLSSILDVRTKSRIPERTNASADIGLIASRLFVETPIVRDKASIWVAGRRTYIDQVMTLINQQLPYYFYDLNAKVNIRPSHRDAIEISHYSGIDDLSLFRDRNNDGDGFLTAYGSGNSSQAVRWQHAFANRWTGNVSLIRTRYNYHIRNAFDENELVARSTIEDLGARISLQRDSVGRTGVFKTGIDVTHHNVSPSVISTTGSITALLESSELPARRTTELGLFTQYEWKPLKELQVNAGIRASAASVGSRLYHYPEPRVSMRYSLDDNTAVKASYSRMAQYMHRISNSAVTMPTDLWYPVTDSVRPQTSHQVALAWTRKFTERDLYLSVETYYKTMNSLIGYEEGTNLFLNNDFESSLIQGKGKAYGVEVLLKKDAGRLTGWLSYTLSWSLRQYDQINSGLWFPSRYDRRHNAAVVAQYKIGRRWSGSFVWEFVSGSRFTPVIGQYIMLSPMLTGIDLIPIYADINSVKLADAHRLDLGLKYLSKPERRFQWQLFFGVYNVYNRANPVGITIYQDETDGSLSYQQPGLFGFLPFVSYGIVF